MPASLAWKVSCRSARTHATGTAVRRTGSEQEPERPGGEAGRRRGLGSVAGQKRETLSIRSHGWRNRIIDLSIGTANALNFYDHGLANVRVEYVGPAPLEGSDDKLLLATLREGSPAPAPSKVML